MYTKEFETILKDLDRIDKEIIKLDKQTTSMAYSLHLMNDEKAELEDRKCTLQHQLLMIYRSSKSNIPSVE